jgi:hypothetical protein
MDHMQLQQSAQCSVVRSRKSEDQLPLRGRFVVEHFRNGEKIGHYEFDNAITNEGKNMLLNVMFHGTTPIGTWYIGLVSGGGTPTLAPGDTYAQIGGSNGWTEFTDYSESTRQEWTEGAASGQSITNSTPLVFDITGSGSVYGPFVVGGGTGPSTKNNHDGGGTLWSAAQFQSGTVPVQNADQLKVTYTVNA